MKLFDYYCPACKQREERWVKKHDEPQEHSCGSVMHKLPPATKTFWKFADRRK